MRVENVSIYGPASIKNGTSEITIITLCWLQMAGKGGFGNVALDNWLANKKINPPNHSFIRYCLSKFKVMTPEAPPSMRKGTP